MSEPDIYTRALRVWVARNYGNGYTLDPEKISNIKLGIESGGCETCAWDESVLQFTYNGRYDSSYVLHHDDPIAMVREACAIMEELRGEEAAVRAAA